jgi:hypothetical protein
MIRFFFPGGMINSSFGNNSTPSLVMNQMNHSIPMQKLPSLAGNDFPFAKLEIQVIFPRSSC